MKPHAFTTTLAALALSVRFASAATVTETDPSPNTYDPETFATLSGGIGYTWTVTAGGNDSATFDGVVGAWSWDEDTFPATAKGWTHTSNWAALELTNASRVTIRITRQENVIDPFATLPGGVGLFNLFPAFTIYTGWDGDGGDHHTYNNRGDVDWAEDVTYLTHVENDGTATVVEGTVELPAGQYSIALGGNSPSTLAEGRQGYGATITTVSLDESAVFALEVGRRFTTTEENYVLKGGLENADSVAKLRLKHGGRTRFVKAKGAKWSFEIKNLKPGRNVIFVSVVSDDGTISAPQRIVVIRKQSYRDLKP